MSDLSKLSDAQLMAMLQQRMQPPPAPPPKPRGLLGDIGAYTRGVASGIADFDPAAMVANLGTRATDAVGLTDGANAAVRRVMGRNTATPRNLSNLSAPPQQSPPDKYAAGGRVVGQMMGGAAAFPTATLPGMIGAGMATSAVTSDAGDTAGFASDVGKGALLTAGIGVGAKVAGRVISPMTARVRANPALAPAHQRAADIVKLQDEGVPLTPGMIAGGTARRIEEGVSSVPVLGSFIRTRERLAIEGVNRAAVNRALSPLGVKLPIDKSGRDVFGFVQNTFDDAYEKARAGLRFEADAPFTQSVDDLVNDARGSAEMSADHIRRLEAQVASMQDRVARAGGALSGDVLKKMVSDLQKSARKLQSGQNPAADQALGEYLETLGRTMDAAAARNANSAPEAVALMRKADQGYGDLVILQNAARSRGGGQSMATVKQLDAAVQKADGTARNNRYLAGNARMQDISDPANRVLPADLPNSGTPERAALMALMAGTVPISGTAAATAGIMSLPYLPGAARLTENLLTRRPGAMVKAGGRLSQFATPMGRVAATFGVPPLLSRPE